MKEAGLLASVKEKDAIADEIEVGIGLLDGVGQTSAVFFWDLNSLYTF